MATVKMRTQSRRRVCAGCSRQIKGKIRKQRCENCYRSHLRTNPATGRRNAYSSPAEVALASIEYAPTGCWLYTGPLDRHGYGRMIRIAGSRALPHRAVYEQAAGPIPEGMQLDHLCHDPDFCPGGVQCLHRRCLNPDHLKPATSRDNTIRSGGITAINARKTHCIHGHEFTEENTRIGTRADGRTWRKCIECHRARQRRNP